MGALNLCKCGNAEALIAVPFNLMMPQHFTKGLDKNNLMSQGGEVSGD